MEVVPLRLVAGEAGHTDLAEVYSWEVAEVLPWVVEVVVGHLGIVQVVPFVVAEGPCLAAVE